MSIYCYLASLILTLFLCILEVHKLETIFDTEKAKHTPYVASKRINRLYEYEYFIQKVLLFIQLFCLSYVTIIIAMLFVYDLRLKSSGRSSISALEFFASIKLLKMQIIIKIIVYIFCTYCYFAKAIFKGA